MLEATSPAFSATGVSVSQEKAGVRSVLYHAELIRISHISGYTGHKKKRRKKEEEENSGRIMSCNGLDQRTGLSCRGVTLNRVCKYTT